MLRQHKRLYECGPFVLDPQNHVLSRHGSPLPLPPKAFETLLVLVEHRGNLIEKDQLLKAVWPDTFVEENNLTQYISLLRRTLGDKADQKQYIETVPRLGYRFVAPVREIVPVEEAIPGQAPQLEKPAPQAQPAAVVQPVSGKPLLIFALLAIIVSAVVAVSWSAYRLRSHATPSPASLPTVAPRRSVAVLGFKSLGRDDHAEWLSTALAEMLNTELSAGEHLRTVSGEDVARARADLKIIDSGTLSKNTLSQVRRNLGADITVSGSFLELGSGNEQQIRLDIQVQDTAVGETIGSIAEVGTVADLFQLISRSGRDLRAKLGASQTSSVEDEQIRAALPSTPEAARLYAQGLTRLREFDAPQAQILLAKAVSIDPNYALGHSALAASWSALGYDEKARVEAKRAFELSQNLSREERLLIAARYREMSREWDKAVEAYQLLFRSFPDDVEYGIRLMEAQTSAGKGRDALATANKLRSLPPPASQDPQIDLAETDAQASLGAFKDEAQTAETAAQKGEPLGENLLVARALAQQAWAFYRLGQPEKAIADLGQAKKLFEAAGDRQGAAVAQRNVANVLTGNGEYTKAHASAAEALRTFEQIGDKRGAAQSLNSLATIEYEQGNLPQAKALYERSLQIQREVGSKVNIAGALGNIANVLDAEGALTEAQKLTEESIQVFTEIGDQRALGTARANLAELMYEQGNLPAARKSYEEALKITREIGYQRGIAFDLQGLSEISEAEGNLPDARKNQEEALSIRNAIGEKHNAAVSLLDLASLALDEGKPAEAQGSASRAIDSLSGEKSAADDAFGQIMLARTYAAQGKLSEAKDALGRAASPSQNSASRPLSFELAIATADLAVAQDKIRPESAAEPRRLLKAALLHAHRSGYLGYEFRLRLAQIEFESGLVPSESTRSALEQLRQDSQAKGFGTVSRQAAQLLAAKSTLNR